LNEKTVLTIIGIAAVITTLTITTERGMVQGALAVHFACQGGSGSIEACPTGHQLGNPVCTTNPAITCEGHSEQAPGVISKTNTNGPPVPHSNVCSSSNKNPPGCSSKDASPGQEFNTG
jgi:hypothetical protein